MPNVFGSVGAVGPPADRDDVVPVTTAVQDTTRSANVKRPVHATGREFVVERRASAVGHAADPGVATDGADEIVTPGRPEPQDR